MVFLPCPLYLAFFQFAHNLRKRGKELFHEAVTTLLLTTPEKA